jgi:hypothetical protein
VALPASTLIRALMAASVWSSRRSLDQKQKIAFPADKIIKHSAFVEI